MEKRKIISPDDFHMALSSVTSALELMTQFDWDHWLASENLAKEAGSQLFPELIEAMEKDPQWEQKVALMRSANNFVREVGDIRASLMAGKKDEE